MIYSRDIDVWLLFDRFLTDVCPRVTRFLTKFTILWEQSHTHNSLIRTLENQWENQWVPYHALQICHLVINLKNSNVCMRLVGGRLSLSLSQGKFPLNFPLVFIFQLTFQLNL